MQVCCTTQPARSHICIILFNFEPPRLWWLFYALFIAIKKRKSRYEKACSRFLRHHNMYLGTFYNGYGLSGEIPVGLFGNISGPLAQHMFDTTFYRCRNLTGPSARNPDGVPLYEQFSNAQATHVMHMYTEDTKLSDYADIPDAWK